MSCIRRRTASARVGHSGSLGTASAVEVVDGAACSSGAFRKNLKGFHWLRSSFIVVSLLHRSWGIRESVLTLWDDCKGHASGEVSEVCKPWRESKALS